MLLLLLSHFSRVRLLVTPQTAVHQAPLFMGFSRQENWSGLPCPPPGDLPDPGIKPTSPALQADSLPSEAPGKSFLHIIAPKNSLVFSKMISHLYSFSLLAWYGTDNLFCTCLNDKSTELCLLVGVFFLFFPVMYTFIFWIYTMKICFSAPLHIQWLSF